MRLKLAHGESLTDIFIFYFKDPADSLSGGQRMRLKLAHGESLADIFIFYFKDPAVRVDLRPSRPWPFSRPPPSPPFLSCQCASSSWGGGGGSLS